MTTIDKIILLRRGSIELMPVLDSVRKDLNESKNDIKINSKTLRQCNVEQPALYAYYDEIRVHLQSVSDYFDIKIAEQRAKTIKYITEYSPNEYGERIREKLVDDDPAYIDLKLKKLEIDEVLEISKSICNQFEQRGYTLNNITKLIVAQAEDDNLIMNSNND